MAPRFARAGDELEKESPARLAHVQMVREEAGRLVGVRAAFAARPQVRDQTIQRRFDTDECRVRAASR